MWADEASVRANWLLDSDAIFLNHGSFGACPRPVLAHQASLREWLEEQPVANLWRDFETRQDAARATVAEFVGADPAGVVFVPNATTGVNVALRALELRAGDELLVSDHGYGATNNAAARVASERGASIRTVHLPFPFRSADEWASSWAAAVGPRTRAAIVDHVTSPTAVVVPVHVIVRALRGRGVQVIVDGAHAPGMLDLDVRSVGASFYTGNLHKWAFVPRATGFLWVDAAYRGRTPPLVTSHGATASRVDRSRLWLEHDWTGTFDPASWWSAEAGIAFGARLFPGGWPALRQRNRDLALWARDWLADALQLDSGPLLASTPDECIGSMAVVPLQGFEIGTIDPRHGATALQLRLWEEFRIEVPIIPWPDRQTWWLRLSAQAYNTRDQFARLAEVLASIRAS